jgi:putative hydrolase of the HAD superfamily
MPIRALFFDLDDTLLETHTAHAAALRLCCEHAARRHPDWTTERLQEAFVRSYRALEAGLEAGEVSFSSQTMFRTRTWDDTLRACGLPPSLGEELTRMYLAERRGRYRLYEDVPDALDALEREYGLVLVTNGLGDLQREKIEAVGLARWIDHIAISGEIGSWKPDSRIFRHALELAGVPPDEVVMVGDSLERDVTGAGSLGIRTVWIRRYDHLAPIEGIRPDAEVADLRSLPSVLARWR